MFYFLGFISILTGLFKAFLIMYFIVFVHELGHIVNALLFNWNIEKIKIYPFGGYTIFNADINKPFIEELLVFNGGILFQFILFILVKIFMNESLYIYQLFMNYNLSILLFNLLPIIPLDGAKVLNILLNKFISFRKSHKITMYISVLSIIILIVCFYSDLNMIMISIILICFLYKECKNRIYLYNMFLIERYIKNINYKNNCFIDGIHIDKMKKYVNNVFIYKNKYIDEKDVLSKKYSCH